MTAPAPSRYRGYLVHLPISICHFYKCFARWKSWTRRSRKKSVSASFSLLKNDEARELLIDLEEMRTDVLGAMKAIDPLRSKLFGRRSTKWKFGYGSAQTGSNPEAARARPREPSYDGSNYL